MAFIKSDRILRHLKSGFDISYYDENDPYYPSEVIDKIGEPEFMNAQLPEELRK